MVMGRFCKGLLGRIFSEKGRSMLLSEEGLKSVLLLFVDTFLVVLVRGESMGSTHEELVSRNSHDAFSSS